MTEPVKRLVVNLLPTLRGQDPNRHWVMALFHDFVNYYHLDTHGKRLDVLSDYFLRDEGVEYFVKWAQEHCTLDLKPFKFLISQNKTLLGYGFEFHHDENLTAFLLQHLDLAKK
jgi:hypothetical protein